MREKYKLEQAELYNVTEVHGDLEPNFWSVFPMILQQWREYKIQIFDQTTLNSRNYLISVQYYLVS